MSAATRFRRPRRWLLAFSCVGLLILAAGVAALPDVERGSLIPAKVAKVTDKARHTPTRIPDRVILTWKGDPSQSQAVTWRTDTSVLQSFAQIALATENKDFAKSATLVLAETTPFKSNLSDAHYHSAEFTGLTPRTKYAYRMGDGTNWSEWFHFRTASDKPEPFTFLYYGDAQNDLRDFWSRVVRESILDAHQSRFIVHAGDLINSANNDAEWGDWFQAGGWLNGTIPSVPTPGNHEYASISISSLLGLKKEEKTDTKQPTRKSGLSKHWRPQFTLPENGPPGLEETVYYMDYQGVRLVSLNSNELQSEQVPWLEEVLANNPNRWTILTFHHPIYSPAKGRDNKSLREKWRPIIDKYRVDLVLTGHDHTYGRSSLMLGDNTLSGTQISDGQSGTVYVVSVSGPKMYSLDGAETWMQASAEQKQLYQAIRVDGDRLHYESRTATGELFDTFELHKSSDGKTRIMERAEMEAEASRWKGFNRVQSWVVASSVGLLALLLMLNLARRSKSV